MPAHPLEPRRTPPGGRALKTVERILEATALLLDEVGFDALTTNAIAERAGVNVASLYKYFPNKYAVLTGLAERMRDEQLALIRRPTEPGAWREELATLLDVFLDLFVSRPGFATLASVLSSSAPLREIDEASLAAEARALSERLAEYGVEGSRADREAIARVALEAARGVLPLARRAGPARRKRLMRELRRMLEAYLAGHIEG
ncbi:MAG: TetR/AcrR family transcriptional regulator [Myxococcota bacterium]|nr:TetR/AcrR family transcriptional regulator [Myxococcota bacterium]